MTTASLLWLAVFVATLLMVVLSLRLLADEDTRTTPGPCSRFFLIALRLAIGWHFFIEATEKLHDPAWSSEGYLRESTGPLAPYFRDLAGDRLIDQLTLADGGLAPELELRWTSYLDALAAYHQLDAEQRLKAQEALDDTKKAALKSLKTRPRKVRLITPADDEDPVFQELTMPQRLKKYDELRAEVRRIEEQDLPHYAEDAQRQWRAAKVNQSKWRAALQKDLDLLNRDLKRSLRAALWQFARKDLPVEPVNYQAKLDEGLKKAKAKRDKDVEDKKVVPPPDAEWEKVAAFRHKADEEDLWIQRKVFAEVKDAGLWDKLSDQTQRIHEQVIDVRKPPATSYDLLPFTVSRPFADWALLDWSDAIVKWGLLVVGLCLLIGFFTRTACVLGALYLLMFYLAMPALPGWPESPRAEGHYLFINKNVIEMLALLTLATFRTGRWAGLDGFLGLLWRRRVAPDETAPRSSLTLG